MCCALVSHPFLLLLPTFACLSRGVGAFLVVARSRWDYRAPRFLCVVHVRRFKARFPRLVFRRVPTSTRLHLGTFTPAMVILCCSPLFHDQIIVPTTDGVRNTYLLDLLIRGGKHVLTCGPTGTGKTVNIAQYLMGQSSVGGR